MASIAKRRIVIGTRGSRLALWQATFVKKLLEEEYGDLEVRLRIIKTTGDKFTKAPLIEIGGKALFLKEIEDQLAQNKITLGVHSMKDVPGVLPAGLTIGAILKREDPRDVFVSKKYPFLMALPKKARVGTSSLRRQAQLKNFRPDLEIIPLRGNVETRLRKLAAGDLAAIVLAAAGLTRLGLANRISEYLSPAVMLPAVGQGAIGLEIRLEDRETRNLIQFLNDPTTAHAIGAERAFLRVVEGNCQIPIAGYAELDGAILKLTGMIASVDGRELVRDQMTGALPEADSIGERVAKGLLARGGREILQRCREQTAKS